MSDVVKIPDLEPIPDDDTILNAMRGIGREAGAALTRTVWKDGIDIDVPNSSAHSFVRQITEPYRVRIVQQDAEIERLRKALRNMVIMTGKPHREEWLNPQAFADALKIFEEAREALERTDQQLQPKGEQG
jgi:hypothetical protein